MRPLPRIPRLPALRVLAVVPFLILFSPKAFALEAPPSGPAPGLPEMVRTLANSLPVRATLRAQNVMHAGLTAPDIASLDQRWREGDRSLIDPVMRNDLSAYLISMAQQGEGLYTEIFVVDAKGLNVGQSAVTTDYWQGDEEEFRRAVQGEQVISSAYIDESTGREQVKVALPVYEPDGKVLRVVGVFIAGLDPSRIAAAP